jgi:hypothetical protein
MIPFPSSMVLCFCSCSFPGFDLETETRTQDTRGLTYIHACVMIPARRTGSRSRLALIKCESGRRNYKLRRSVTLNHINTCMSSRKLSLIIRSTRPAPPFFVFLTATSIGRQRRHQTPSDERDGVRANSPAGRRAGDRPNQRTERRADAREPTSQASSRHTSPLLGSPVLYMRSMLSAFTGLKSPSYISCSGVQQQHMAVHSVQVKWQQHT